MDRYSQDYSLIQTSFAISANYWRSSENNNNNAWNFNFKNGKANNNKNNTKQVRAVRVSSIRNKTPKIIFRGFTLKFMQLSLFETNTIQEQFRETDVEQSCSKPIQVAEKQNDTHKMH